jgi:hypothetical protein
MKPPKDPIEWLRWEEKRLMSKMAPTLSQHARQMDEAYAIGTALHLLETRGPLESSKGRVK